MRKKLMGFGIGLVLVAMLDAADRRASGPRSGPTVRPALMLDQPVAAISTQTEGIEDVMSDARAGTVLYLSLAVMGVAVLLFGRWGGVEALLDCLAYEAPIAAAIFAGITVYRGGSKGFLFLVTIFFLYMGTVAYMATRGHGANVLVVTTLLVLLVINGHFIATATHVTKTARAAKGARPAEAVKTVNAKNPSKAVNAIRAAKAALVLKAALVVKATARLKTAMGRITGKVEGRGLTIGRVVGAWIVVLLISLLILNLAFFADVTAKCVQLPRATRECFEYWRFPWLFR